MGSPKVETLVPLLASFALFMVLPVIISHCPIPAYASTLEAQALLKWKSSLPNQNQSSASLSTWTLPPQNATDPNVTAASPCSWYGILCNLAGSVIGINLPSSNIRGTLDEFPFSSLLYLTYIDMYRNELFGGIPPQVGVLINLTYLELSINRLYGKIPCEIGELTKLEVLHLFSNELNGSIPDEIGQLRFLNELALFSNQLDGSLPSSLANLIAKLQGMMNGQNGQEPQDNSLYMRHMSGSMTYYDSVNVIMKGKEIQLLHILTILTTFDLSLNSFEGTSHMLLDISILS
ncbi:hypothetical protein NL676_022772 [Syzygium grande]|nr:hypothetical protein NL676_022772 [Syzygium grande]